MRQEESKGVDEDDNGNKKKIEKGKRGHEILRD